MLFSRILSKCYFEVSHNISIFSVVLKNVILVSNDSSVEVHRGRTTATLRSVAQPTTHTLHHPLLQQAAIIFLLLLYYFLVVVLPLFDFIGQYA